ncbi:hypothetical protein FF098_014340 [Parvularcula flava]|uniref:Uncharacterized protein n=1 Tax=Aquisalinus luteolus TaxID=1566827 RepID=A0A8J3ERP6_9PROT|nr:hypothetical protein [Aquisalinus luteolus]NHK29098.1 hypothetical protein [Aquisalinus luteolus]GGI00310.1 hypothetical protein GCM10011355_28300 [Aquisalinus luteolus]
MIKPTSAYIKSLAAGALMAASLTLPGFAAAQEAQIMQRSAQPVDPRPGQLAGEEVLMQDEARCEEVYVVIVALGVGLRCRDYTTKEYDTYVIDTSAYPEMGDRVVALLASNKVVQQLEEDIGMEQWLTYLRHRALKPGLKDLCDMVVRRPGQETCREVVRVQF